MRRVLFSFVLGLLSPFVGILGASPFEVPGQNPIRERVAGGLAVALYLALCQFLVAPRESRRLGAKWPTMVAMAASLLAMCLLIVASEGGKAWVFSAGPMLISGCLGIVVGAVVAGWVELPAVSLEFCRRSLLTGAAVLVVVALVVAAGVIPSVKADRSPQAAPDRAARLFWGIVVLDVVLAACVAFIAVRTGHGRRTWPVAVGSLAFLGFIVACFLATTAAFLTHDPPMWTAAILGVFCSAAEFIVAGLLSVTALLLPKRT